LLCNLWPVLWHRGSDSTYFRFVMEASTLLTEETLSSGLWLKAPTSTDLGASFRSSLRSTEVPPASEPPSDGVWCLSRGDSPAPCFEERAIQDIVAREISKELRVEALRASAFEAQPRASFASDGTLSFQDNDSQCSGAFGSCKVNSELAVARELAQVVVSHTFAGLESPSYGIGGDSSSSTCRQGVAAQSTPLPTPLGAAHLIASGQQMQLQPQRVRHDSEHSVAESVRSGNCRATGRRTLEMIAEEVHRVIAVQAIQSATEGFLELRTDCERKTGQTALLPQTPSTTAASPDTQRSQQESSPLKAASSEAKNLFPDFDSSGRHGRATSCECYSVMSFSSTIDRSDNVAFEVAKDSELFAALNHQLAN